MADLARSRARQNGEKLSKNLGGKFLPAFLKAGISLKPGDSARAE